MAYWVDIEVANPTSVPRTFTVPKGRMISPKDLRTKAQNLVVTQDTTVTVPPQGKVIVTVPTDCTDPSLPAPNSTVMDVTTFGQQQTRHNVFPGRRM